jgi:hypothetical protein
MVLKFLAFFGGYPSKSRVYVTQPDITQEYRDDFASFRRGTG